MVDGPTGFSCAVQDSGLLANCTLFYDMALSLGMVKTSCRIHVSIYIRRCLHDDAREAWIGWREQASHGDDIDCAQSRARSCGERGAGKFAQLQRIIWHCGFPRSQHPTSGSQIPENYDIAGAGGSCRDVRGDGLWPARSIDERTDHRHRRGSSHRRVDEENSPFGAVQHSCRTPARIHAVCRFPPKPFGSGAERTDVAAKCPGIELAFRYGSVYLTGGPLGCSYTQQ